MALNFLIARATDGIYHIMRKSPSLLDKERIVDLLQQRKALTDFLFQRYVSVLWSSDPAVYPPLANKLHTHLLILLFRLFSKQERGTCTCPQLTENRFCSLAGGAGRSVDSDSLRSVLLGAITAPA